MREELEQPYEDVASWGQAVKGDKPFADLVFQKIGEPKLPRRGLTVETVAREVAKWRRLSLEKMRSPSQGRAEAVGRALVAWAAREVGQVSIARTAKYFNRDASSMARVVERLVERAGSDKELLKFSEDLAAKLRPTCHLARLTPARRQRGGRESAAALRSAAGSTDNIGTSSFQLQRRSHRRRC